MTGNDDQNDEIVRKIAEHELESATESYRRVMEEHSAAFRWLLASLLAINGGGILALKDAFKTPSHASVVAGALFLVGVICALLTGWFSQRANRAIIEPLAKMRAFWILCAETNQFNEEGFKEAIESTGTALKKARPSQICGWLSAVAFILGASTMLSAAYREIPPAKSIAPQANPASLKPLRAK